MRQWHCRVSYESRYFRTLLFVFVGKVLAPPSDDRLVSISETLLFRDLCNRCSFSLAPPFLIASLFPLRALPIGDIFRVLSIYTGPSQSPLGYGPETAQVPARCDVSVIFAMRITPSSVVSQKKFRAPIRASAR
jgi:hypothetical protein